MRTIAAECGHANRSFWIVGLPMWIERRFWLPAVPFVLITAAHAGARRTQSSPDF